MNPATLYAMGVKRNLHNYYANWLPDTEVRLGDVGILRDGLFFERITNLEELGIPVQVRQDPHPTPLEFVSDGGVTIHFKAAGEVNEAFPTVPQAEAAIGFDFNREGAFVFKANECYEPSIESLSGIQDQVLDLLKEGRWDKKWVIVVKAVTTPMARILISEDRDSRLVLTTKSKVDFPALSLGNASLAFDVKRHRGRLFTQLEARQITPFFQIARLKSRLFDQPRLRQMVRSVRPLDPMEYVTPEMLRLDPKVSRELYLDVVRDTEEMPGLFESLALQRSIAVPTQVPTWEAFNREYSPLAPPRFEGVTERLMREPVTV